jgi:hypothetical protein
MSDGSLNIELSLESELVARTAEPEEPESNGGEL